MDILRVLGEKCGYEAAESTPAILSPQTDRDRREASFQQVGYGIHDDGISEFGTGFDKGYCEGIRKARKQHNQ